MMHIYFVYHFKKHLGFVPLLQINHHGLQLFNKPKRIYLKSGCSSSVGRTAQMVHYTNQRQTCYNPIIVSSLHTLTYKTYEYTRSGNKG